MNSSTYKPTHKTFTTNTTEVVVPKGNANFPDTCHENYLDSGYIGTGLKPVNKGMNAGSTYKPQN